MIIVVTLVPGTYRHKAVIMVIVLFTIYVVINIATGIRSTKGNRPVSNSLQPLIQSEFECEVFLMNISFHSF